MADRPSGWASSPAAASCRAASSNAAAPPDAMCLSSRSKVRPSPRRSRACRMPGAGSAAAATGLALLRENRVTELVLAGGMRRPSLAALRPDWRAARLFARIGYRALGDDGLLSAVVRELEQEGFRVVGADQLLDQAPRAGGTARPAPPGCSKRKPISSAGCASPGALGALDIGQAVVVQQGLVLGVEAIEGTDELLRRCAALRREGPGGVLVKVEKPGQEPRADRPTIGPRTVLLAAESRIARDRRRGRRHDRARPRRGRPRCRSGRAVPGRPRPIVTADDANFIFIVTGEPSGDALGGALIAALRQRTGGRLRVAGIGGERMREQGLESLVPLADLADHGRGRGVAARPGDPAACARDGSGDPRAAPRCRRDDRQLRVQLAGGARAAPLRRDLAAHSLRRADGLGLARRAGPAHGALVRPSDDLAAVRAALFRAGRAVLQLCRSSGSGMRRRPRRRGAFPRGARSRRRRAADHGIARQPRRRGAASAADFRRGAEPAGRPGRAVPRRRADRRDGRGDGRRCGQRDWPGDADRRAAAAKKNTTPSRPAAPRSPPPDRSRSNWRWRGCRWSSAIASTR